LGLQDTQLPIAYSYLHIVYSYVYAISIFEKIGTGKMHCGGITLKSHKYV